jgi:3-hydroxyacyl-CoA dehydrogenase
MKHQTIGIVGTGLIGSSWAAFFAGRGYRAKMFDPDPGALDRAVTAASEMLAFLIDKGLTADRAGAHLLDPVGSLEEAAIGVEWVQESAAEDYQVKHQVYRVLDAAAAEDVVLASSSSGLLITEIQKAAARPERCLIAHPFNPPHLVPLVELVPGKRTSPEKMAEAARFLEGLGKLPVVLKKEVPGHIANRLAAALWREAIDLVLSGVATVGDVDRAVFGGPGIRWALMGPHLTYHLGGGEGGIEHFIEHLGPAFESWWEDLAAWSRPPDRAREVLAQGLREEIRGQSPAELARWRDRKLVELIKDIHG